MEGLDDIGLTLEKAHHIEAFERESGMRRPWA
jgi:3-isopropylmalate dehydratase small subunit